MHKGMKLEEFKKEWILHFASNIPKRDIQRKVIETGNYIWHIFSWKLVKDSDYLTGNFARSEFDRADKSGAFYIIPFERSAEVKGMTKNKFTAEILDKEAEVYVVSRDLSWTYIKTHESDLGPYFYKKISINHKNIQKTTKYT